MKYKVKMSDDIERDMIVDFFEPKIEENEEGEEI